MSRYGMLSDDYYVNMNLNTEMELPQSRETLLHFFEQIRKKYPSMRNFYSRERGEFVLEEDKERGNSRWVTIEQRRISSGQFNPETIDDALQQHRMVLEHAPFVLSVTPLDCESLYVTFGFDYTYRGNHNQLLVDAFGVIPAFERMTEIPGASVLCNEPMIQLAMDDECRTQVRLSVETRTNSYHVRTGDYPEEQISVYLTARRHGSLEPGETFCDAMQRLSDVCEEILESHVIEHVLRPLQQTIAIK